MCSTKFNRKFTIDDQAFEDLVIDYEKGIAYMPSDNRQWLHTNELSNTNYKKQGKIFTFDIQSEKFTQLHLKNYPFEHFHPIGIDRFKKNNLVRST